MDRFNGLSDELLVKILSFLPTKDAVSTSILSKRWEFGKRIIYESEFSILRCFLDRNLPLHRAPVIESFRLELSDSHIRPEDIRMWVVVVVSRYVRELEICVSCYPNKHNVLPSSLYTRESLVILKLHGRMLLDVPRMVFLPSLKTLELKIVRYSSKGSLQGLLSNCPVLEDLLVDLHHCDKTGKFTIIVPSLHRLSLDIPYGCHIDGFVIDTPSLEYFKLVDRSSNGHIYLIENMPKLVEAYVDAISADLKTLFRLITSVKVLTIHLKVVYHGGFIFNHLEHLTLSVREKYSSNFLVRFLKNSPNLREIKYISKVHDHEDLAMNQPSTFPECKLSSLQDFTWSQYLGRPQDIAIAVYILKNAPRLRIATIFLDTRLVPELEMVKELARSSRASTTCVLNFY